VGMQSVASEMAALAGQEDLVAPAAWLKAE
jgi:hypothetical protein